MSVEKNHNKEQGQDPARSIDSDPEYLRKIREEHLAAERPCNPPSHARRVVSESYTHSKNNNERK